MHQDEPSFWDKVGWITLLIGVAYTVITSFIEIFNTFK